MRALFNKHKSIGQLVVVVAGIHCVDVSAQVTDTTKAIRATTPESTEQQRLAQDELIMDSSEEQGQVSLEDSFGPQSPRDIVRAQRKKAWQDTAVSVQLRSYYLDRNQFDNSESQAMALGGHIGVKTGYFRDRFAFGATAYTAQRIYGPEDKGGTNLLAPIQQGYGVVGEIYGEYRIAEGVTLDVGRKGINTSYINESDTRMTPATFQLATVIGQLDSTDGSSQWRFGGGYVDKIKEKTAEKFVSMAEAAGVFNLNRGVYVAGVNLLKKFQSSELSIGAIDFYSNDILNIFYTEAKYTMPIGDNKIVQFATQYSAQQSTGDNLQTGSPFSSNQLGIKAELDMGRALFTSSWTGNGSGADLQSPWGGIPSYNSVQVEDFNYAGVDSFLVRAAYEFKSLPGLSAYALWVNGSQPDNVNLSAQDEYDFNVKWLVGNGVFKGLSMRVRYALVTQENSRDNLNDFRIIFNYDPSVR